MIIILQALILHPGEGEAPESRGQGPVPAHAHRGSQLLALQQGRVRRGDATSAGQVRVVSYDSYEKSETAVRCLTLTDSINCTLGQMLPPTNNYLPASTQ